MKIAIMGAGGVGVCKGRTLGIPTPIAAMIYAILLPVLLKAGT
jgi:hypothetical protein